MALWSVQSAGFLAEFSLFNLLHAAARKISTIIATRSFLSSFAMDPLLSIVFRFPHQSQTVFLNWSPPGVGLHHSCIAGRPLLMHDRFHCARSAWSGHRGVVKWPAAPCHCPRLLRCEARYFLVSDRNNRRKRPTNRNGSMPMASRRARKRKTMGKISQM